MGYIANIIDEHLVDGMQTDVAVEPAARLQNLNDGTVSKHFKAVRAQVVKRVRVSIKPINILGTVFSILSIGSSAIGLYAAIADPSISMKIGMGLGSAFGIVSAAVCLCSMRGAQSPYAGSLRRTWMKAAGSPDASIDSWQRAWSLPMAVITHVTQLYNAYQFNRTDLAWICFLGLPGEIFSITGTNRLARFTKAVEQGLKTASDAVRKKTVAGKMATCAKIAVVSPFGSYMIGRVNDVLALRDASKLLDPAVMVSKQHAIESGFALASLGTAVWLIQVCRGLLEARAGHAAGALLAAELHVREPTMPARPPTSSTASLGWHAKASPARLIGPLEARLSMQ